MSSKPPYIYSISYNVPAGEKREGVLFENTTGKNLRLRRIIFYADSSPSQVLYFTIFFGAKQVLPDAGAFYPSTSKMQIDTAFELPAGSRLNIKITNSTSSDVRIFIILVFEVLE